MSETPAQATTYRLTSFHILLVAIITQLALVPYLWGHTSTNPQFLGRYSIRYGAGLIVAAVLSLLWPIMALRYKQIEGWLQKFPSLLIATLLFMEGVVIVALFEIGMDGHLLF